MVWKANLYENVEKRVDFVEPFAKLFTAALGFVDLSVRGCLIIWVGVSRTPNQSHIY